MAQKNGFVLWLTGLSGSGKTTLAERIYERIRSHTPHVERLDGDVLRGVFPSTGFSREARDEHIKRVGFMASLLEKHGVKVICSFISPYRNARRFVRDHCEHFIEVYVKASVEECEKRDVKGLYRKARAGEITGFTGIDDPYEAPESPEIIVDTDAEDVEQSLDKIMRHLEPYLNGDN